MNTQIRQSIYEKADLIETISLKHPTQITQGDLDRIRELAFEIRKLLEE